MADLKGGRPTKDERRHDRPERETQVGDGRQDDRLRAVGLTEMEERIFEGLIHGKTRRQICREQGIGHTAYDNYLALARRYLGVRTTVEAVAIYVREKIRREEEEEEEED